MKKPPHPLRPIYWSLGVIIFLMTLLFGMGVFYQSVLNKIEAHIAAGTSVADLDTRLSKRIGKPYDKAFHDQLITIFDSDAKGVDEILKASDALSRSVLQVAGAVTLICLWTVFLLVRKAHQFQKILPAPENPPSSES
jgi:hypothetical protein